MISDGVQIVCRLIMGCFLFVIQEHLAVWKGFCYELDGISP